MPPDLARRQLWIVSHVHPGRFVIECEGDVRLIPGPCAVVIRVADDRRGRAPIHRVESPLRTAQASTFDNADASLAFETTFVRAVGSIR